ncbi:hypothetical protein [Streptomyces sp. NPDC102264]|uniref:hypothetical protein n=1 Tax=Streptomyces sp. NPDC102264 TaxID=3366149 RepID=UPI00382924DF
MRSLMTPAAVAVVLAVAAVPAAAADYTARDASSCTRNDRDRWEQNANLSRRAPVRTGPGGEYRVRARIGPLALVHIWCSTTSRSGQRWYYGRADLSSSGPGRVTGWIWSGHL